MQAEGEWCECERRERRGGGWLENPREDKTACILRDGQVRGGERFIAHIYCPLKSPTAAENSSDLSHV